MMRSCCQLVICGLVLVLITALTITSCVSPSTTPVPSTTPAPQLTVVVPKTMPTPVPTPTALSPLPTPSSPAPSAYQLDVEINPPGSGLVEPSSGKYDAGTRVLLQAAPADSCWRFDHWGGDLSGNTTPIGVPLTANKNITAYFAKIRYALTATVSPAGSGTVGPIGGTYACGQSVTIAATPAAGFDFDYWSGDASGTATFATITMQANRSVTANFKSAFQTIKRIMPPGAAVQNTISFSNQLKAGQRIQGFVELTGDTPPGEEIYVWSFSIIGPRTTIVENWRGNVVSTQHHDFDKVVPVDGVYVMKVEDNSRIERSLTIQIQPGGW